MKILLLADPSSAHVIKWANSLSVKNMDVFIFGLSTYDKQQFHSSIKVVSDNSFRRIKSSRNGSWIKVVYLSKYFKLNRFLKEIRPDILHAHYASSYGLLGSIINYHPFILSVWGTDIVGFPKRSILHKKILQRVFQSPDAITATSEYLKTQIKLYTARKVTVIPFGIDTDKFRNKPQVKRSQEGTIVIGIFKSLEDHYGIDLLIKAFEKIHRRGKVPLKLMIVGDGSLKGQLMNLVERLKLKDHVQFMGKVGYNNIENYHNLVDIAVYPSIRDSFGVSVLESSACEKPVIVSNIGGLPEVTINNQTGLIVSPMNIESLTNALEKLISDPSLRKTFGTNGRNFVKQNYEWERNVDQMIQKYKELLGQD